MYCSNSGAHAHYGLASNASFVVLVHALQQQLMSSIPTTCTTHR
jgi:hypothetical protein